MTKPGMMRLVRTILAGIALVAVVLALALFLPTKPVSLNIPPLPLAGEEAEAKTHILFVGDIMLDRYIRRITENVGGDYIFSCIDQALFLADTVVGNLEGPITNNPSVSFGEGDAAENTYRFTFPPETAALLKRHNISIVNLGNNHMLDQGRDGLVQTKMYLQEAGVAFFGLPADLSAEASAKVGGSTQASDLILFSNSRELENSENESVLRKEIHGIPFSFVNYNEFSPNASTTIYGSARVIREEQEAGRVVVVYTHWGEEYVPPPARVKALAHQFADAGAAIVIGSHPHIVQEHEVYNGIHIYYSLGNFIFDQYWDESVKNGLMLDVEFSRTGVTAVKEIPIVLHSDGRTCPK